MAKKKKPAKKSQQSWQYRFALWLDGDTSKISASTRKKYTIIVAAIVVISLISLYAYGTILFNYGGIRGLRYERKPFPGVNSAEIVNGKQTVLDSFQQTENKVLAAVNSKPAAETLLQTADKCEKGLHQFGPFARFDNYSYSCELAARRVFAFTAPLCEVAGNLDKANIYIAIHTDCLASVPSLTTNDTKSIYYNAGQYLGGGASIKLYSQSEFFEPLSPEYDERKFPGSNYDCETSFGLPKVHCQLTNTQQEILDTFKASASAKSLAGTILVFEITPENYYKK